MNSVEIYVQNVRNATLIS